MLGTPLRRCSATGSRRTRRAWAEREPSGQADLFGEFRCNEMPTSTAIFGGNHNPRLQHDHDLLAAFTHLITTTSIDWGLPQQAADGRLEPWPRQWRMNPPLPHSHVLDGLQEEYRRHQRIRRSFVFSYQHRSPLELFIAAMASGLGTDNRGPAKVRTILTQPNAAKAIEAVVSTVRQDGALATGADPLHLALVFNIDHANAMAYANAARSLHSGPVPTDES